MTELSTVHLTASQTAGSTHQSPTRPPATAPMPEPALSDTDAMDAIATILGTTAEWDADMTMRIHSVAALVRPSAALGPNNFAAAFIATTGRPLPGCWDARTDEDCPRATRRAQSMPWPQLHRFAADIIAGHYILASHPDMAGPATEYLALGLLNGRRTRLIRPNVWDAALAALEEDQPGGPGNEARSRASE